MPQRIRCARDPEDRARVARRLGLAPGAVDHGHALLWSRGAQIAGAAHVLVSGSLATVDAFELTDPRDAQGAGIALARMAIWVAVADGAGAAPVTGVRADLPGYPTIRAALKLDGPVTEVAALARGLPDLPAAGASAWVREIYGRDALIARIGDPIDALQVVARGSVRVVGVDHGGSPREIGQIGPGELLSDALLAGGAAHPLHVLANAAQVDLMALPRAEVERLRYTPSWSAWLQRALTRRVAALSGRLLNGVEPAVMARIVEVLRDRGEGRCPLAWLSEQTGVPVARVRALFEPLWASVSLQGDRLTVHDWGALAAIVGPSAAPAEAVRSVGRPQQRGDLALGEPAL